MSDWTSWLARWTEAGLIDPATAGRIREFEQQHVGSTRLRWPIVVALAFGALMLAGGVLLFVAAHPGTRCRPGNASQSSSCSSAGSTSLARW